jgi:hypothetical protein
MERKNTFNYVDLMVIPEEMEVMGLMLTIVGKDGTNGI